MLHQNSLVKTEIRHDWTSEDVTALWTQPFNDLIFQAQSVHRRHFRANELQMSQLLSIKTGGCPEDCGYCSQSAKFDTGLKASKLMEVDAVIEEARKARDNGASRYCLGAAWRGPKDRDLDQLCAMVQGLQALGLETCMTLGMLTDAQALRLKEAGLDYYNHNIDTSPRYYPEVTTTRSFQDRLDTLERVRHAGMKVCCGGIIGMGERREDRIDMLLTLANLEQHPESVPINGLMPTKGTPLGDSTPLDPLEFVCTIAIARILMPNSVVRLSAGRENMSDELQALCFLAGANSVFVGDKLLTTDNPERGKDARLFKKLGLEPAANPA
ncbi:MAG: biotin synthase BioB [Geminicoccales bacterium]